MIGAASAAPPVGALDFGDLRRTAPFCEDFGFGRGTPIDRFYLGQFIAQIRDLVRGDVVEIGGKRGNRMTYGPGVESYRAMDVLPDPEVDVVGNMLDRSAMPPESCDAILAFNVLEHVEKPWVAVDNMHAWLRPGGRAFVMVPVAQRVHRIPRDCWRILPEGMAVLFSAFREKTITSWGNPLAFAASMFGASCEDLSRAELDARHVDYPVLTCVSAAK